MVAAILFSNTVAPDAQWGRLLSVANGPGAIFTTVLGAILGFAANQANVSSAKKEQQKAEGERAQAQEGRETAMRAKEQAVAQQQRAEKDAEASHAKVRAAREMLDQLPSEIEGRRNDPSAYVPHLYFEHEGEQLATQSLRVGGDFRLAKVDSPAPIDPLLERVNGVVTAARITLSDPSDSKSS